MERAGASPTLHQRLMSAIMRGARVQEHSRLIIAQHIEVDEHVLATLAVSRRRRAERARARDVRIRTRR